MDDDKKSGKTILVAGATGYIGNAVVAESVRRGHDVIAVTRSLKNDCQFEGAEVVLADVTNPESDVLRAFLSKGGTFLSNLLPGTKLEDMTSGFEAFDRNILGMVLAYPLKVRAHFFQTEIKYLLWRAKYKEIPITYQYPSNSISNKAVTNSIFCLCYYLFLRIIGRAPSLT
jgi:dolichol-phosphate mannosyltransferase